jgi:hypothetical protein
MTIIVCSQIRSGGTVTYQACAHFVETLGLGIRLGYTEHFTSDRYHNPTRWNVVKVPELNEESSKLLLNQEALGIFTFRDIPESVGAAQEAFKLTDDQYREWYYKTVKHVEHVNKLAIESVNIYQYSYEFIKNDFEYFISILYSELIDRIIQPIKTSAISDLNLARQRARPKVYPIDLNTLLMHNHFRGD